MIFSWFCWGNTVLTLRSKCSWSGEVLPPFRGAGFLWGVCVCVCSCLSMEVRGHPWLLILRMSSTCSTETGSLPDLGLWASGFYLSLPPQCWEKEDFFFNYIWLSYVCSGNLNSGPHVSVTSIFFFDWEDPCEEDLSGNNSHCKVRSQARTHILIP